MCDIVGGGKWEDRYKKAICTLAERGGGLSRVACFDTSGPAPGHFRLSISLVCCLAVEMKKLMDRNQHGLPLRHCTMKKEYPGVESFVFFSPQLYTLDAYIHPVTRRWNGR